MAILVTDILYRLSAPGAGAGNTTAQADPNASLGEWLSTTDMDLATTLNNLFDDVAGAESSAGDVEYRCIFVVNNHATLTLQNAVVWIESEVANGASVEIGLDPAGNVAVGAVAAQAAVVEDESTAPAGVVFSAPTTKAGGLSIGNLGPQQCRAIWLKRTVPAGAAALNNDGATLRVEGETAA